MSEPEVIPLAERHGWRCPPGYKLFVADRGAVRFAVPKDWVFVRTDDCLRFYDRPEPDADCTVGVSVLRLSAVDVPMRTMVEVLTTGTELDVLSRGPAVVERLGTADVGRVDVRVRDPSGREAISRSCLARNGTIGALITFDLWADDAARLDPVWETVLKTLELGRFVFDPRTGDTLS